MSGNVRSIFYSESVKVLTISLISPSILVQWIWFYNVLNILILYTKSLPTCQESPQTQSLSGAIFSSLFHAVECKPSIFLPNINYYGSVWDIIRQIQKIFTIYKRQSQSTRNFQRIVTVVKKNTWYVNDLSYVVHFETIFETFYQLCNNINKRLYLLLINFQ